jgi:hypothetical protein
MGPRRGRSQWPTATWTYPAACREAGGRLSSVSLATTTSGGLVTGSRALRAVRVPLGDTRGTAPTGQALRAVSRVNGTDSYTDLSG